jgi:acyl-CoA hydrolase
MRRMNLHDNVDTCVDAVLALVGKRIRLATPLGIGKPNHLLNAFYRRAKVDPSIDLHILTALTLQPPRGQSDLEQRFLGPLVERVWGDHPDLDYELDRISGRLPPNVRVIEFYFYAGKLLGNAAAQRDYISTNYTYVARDLLSRGVNVLAQQVCRGQVDGQPMLSLSCNPDVTLDLLRGLRASGRPFAACAQLNEQLPFMYGDAVVPETTFDLLVDDPSQHYRLFGTPKTAVSDEEYLIGLYASTLIKDGGELQIGIGSLGDALVYALLLRHERNEVYQQVLERLGIRVRFGEVIDRLGETGRFEQGLFAATEMLVDGFMHLMDAGIVKRKVYDDVPLQRLLNTGKITERVTPETLDALLAHKAIGPVLDEADFTYLQHWGVLRALLRFVDGEIVLPDGTRIVPDLRNPASRQQLCERGLGDALLHGCVAHAGFFLGPERFYQWLRELPVERRKSIDMRSVTRINQLYGHEELDRLHRRNARFVNTAMMVTVLGAVVSDGLENGQVVSGVGGQYNFVAMAHALPDGRSVLQVRSTRTAHGAVASNIVYNYGHTTIPRHQRDLFVTEYGIADARGKTDEEVVQAVLAVSDSRFQPGLLERAKREGKLAGDYELPARYAHNHPEGYQVPLAELKQRGLFPAYPFATELSAQEIVLGRALRALKDKIESKKGALEAMAEAVVDGALGDDVRPYLERMGLGDPQNLKETLYQRLLAAELRQVITTQG